MKFLKKLNKRQSNKKAIIDSPEKIARREAARIAQAKRRAKETPEKRARRLEANRITVVYSILYVDEVTVLCNAPYHICCTMMS